MQNEWYELIKELEDIEDEIAELEASDFDFTYAIDCLTNRFNQLKIEMEELST